MSTILAAQWSSQSSDPPAPASNLELLDTPPEAPPLEPRRIHVSRPLVWAILILFSLTIVAMGLWGLGHSTLTYGMSPVGPATTERLAQLQTRLKEANAPKAALRYMAIASQPGVNIGDATEALANAEKALEPASGKREIASALAELRVILRDLNLGRYGGYGGSGGSGLTTTPLPTLLLTAP
jgi:hypothetical protein